MDIGCSNGLFLDMAKDAGYKTKGVEMNIDAAKKAILKGHKVFIGDIVTSELPRYYADIIVMFHTLEHLHSLSIVLEKIKSLLKQKGILIIEVPNLWHWILQKRFFIKRSLAPERHLYHFTPKTLRYLFNKLGFKIVKIEPANRYDRKGFLDGLIHSTIRIFSTYFYFFTGYILSNSMRFYVRET